METNTNQPPFKKERQQTDDSLTHERGKTDDSFESYREKNESDTDRAVTANRLEADKARIKSRSDVDVEREGKEKNISSKKDRDTNELQLRDERQLEDTVINQERKKNDVVIELERDENERILNKLVSLEREATDKNLLEERTKTDLATILAAKLLKLEQTAHSGTKSALTSHEEFVAIVSHDLKNPIGTILSSVEILMEHASMATVDDDAKRWLEVIKRNAETSIRLISDILDMERIVEGKIQLKIAPCQISDLIRDVIESYIQAANVRQINLKSLKTNFDGLINCDRDRIAQILSNIIGNALKFTPKGGSVSVSVEEAKNEIKFSVKDTGPGIPTDQQTRIFERFAQIGNKSRSGLGLGLYISKTLVESHRGRIWVESSDGAGSEFCFTLPQT